MSKLLKKAGTFLYYITGAGILAYILFSIGLDNIVKILSGVNLNFMVLALLITVICSVLRIYKMGLLMNSRNHAEVFDLFVFSRVGKELSFAGYFMPMARKNNRNIDTVSNLLIDRYTEIFSTIAIGLISLLFIMKQDFIHQALLAMLAGTTLLLLTLPFINTNALARRFKNKFILKFIEIVSNLQQQVNIVKSGILYIYFLSIVATGLDFLTAYILMLALNMEVNFLIIPVVWASSGLMSILGFMIIGTTEISVIYLYDKLAGISTALTASFVFISRIVNILALLILWLINLIVAAINKMNVSKAKAL